MRKRCIKYHDESIIQWHNLRNNPDDLPDPKLPPLWYIVMIDDGEIYCVSTALYIPNQKKWLIAAPKDAIDNNFNDPEGYPLYYRKPVNPVTMWAEYPNCAEFAKEPVG